MPKGLSLPLGNETSNRPLTSPEPGPPVQCPEQPALEEKMLGVCPEPANREPWVGVCPEGKQPERQEPQHPAQPKVRPECQDPLYPERRGAYRQRDQEQHCHRTAFLCPKVG